MRKLCTPPKTVKTNCYFLQQKKAFVSVAFAKVIDYLGGFFQSGTVERGPQPPIFCADICTKYVVKSSMPE